MAGCSNCMPYAVHKATRVAEARARQKLHRVWAAYLGEPNYDAARSSLSEAFAKGADRSIRRACESVLVAHASTRERIAVAEQLYGKLMRMTGSPQSILDLACALNPLFFRWMGLPRTVVYRAVDINSRIVDLVNHYLFTAGVPDPDLIIRTSGELRGSNFLIWQGAYSEWYFPPVYWPDFDKEQLRLALEEYNRRERRYGRLLSRKGKNAGDAR